MDAKGQADIEKLYNNTREVHSSVNRDRRNIEKALKKSDIGNHLREISSSFRPSVVNRLANNFLSDLGKAFKEIGKTLTAGIRASLTPLGWLGGALAGALSSTALNEGEDNEIVINALRKAEDRLRKDEQSEKNKSAAGDYYFDGNKPVLLDLNGDGAIDIDGGGASKASFDFDGDGRREGSSWIGASSPTGEVEDGFLVADLNADGDIQGSELALAQLTDDPNDTDVDALASRFDSNGDGAVDEADKEFSKLGVWQDANADGTVDDGEFASLGAHGISRIDVGEGRRGIDNMTAKELAAWDLVGDGDNLADGSKLFGVTTFTKDGKQHLVGDVGLAASKQDVDDYSDEAASLGARTDALIHEIAAFRPEAAMDVADTPRSSIHNKGQQQMVLAASGH